MIKNVIFLFNNKLRRRIQLKELLRMSKRHHETS